MSYIPDFRKETDKLKGNDKAYVQGYRAAIEDAKSFFDNLDIYETTEDEEKVLEDARGCFEDYMEMEETETVLSVFENGDYDDVELVDANKPLCVSTKGALKYAHD